MRLITRAERLTRRMLKRSLGDRTWNAGEIANDLRRLNEDAQTFLSVHTVRPAFGISAELRVTLLVIDQDIGPGPNVRPPGALTPVF